MLHRYHTLQRSYCWQFTVSGVISVNKFFCGSLKSIVRRSKCQFRQIIDCLGKSVNLCNLRISTLETQRFSLEIKNMLLIQCYSKNKTSLWFLIFQMTNKHSLCSTLSPCFLPCLSFLFGWREVGLVRERIRKEVRCLVKGQMSQYTYELIIF